MNIYLLKAYDSDGMETRWSHSKLDLIHDGQEFLKEGYQRSQVYKVTLTEKTPRLLVIRLLNKQALDRSYELVWEGKSKEDKRNYPEIEPTEVAQ
jgi:hypothetical protein